MSTPSLLWSSYTRSWGLLRHNPIIMVPYVALFLTQDMLSQWNQVPVLDPMHLTLQSLQFFGVLWVCELVIKAGTTFAFIIKANPSWARDPKWAATKLFHLFVMVGLLILPPISGFAATLLFPDVLWAKLLLMAAAVVLIPSAVLLEFAPSLVLAHPSADGGIAYHAWHFLRHHFLKGFVALSLGLSSLVIVTVVGQSLQMGLPFAGGLLGALLQGAGYAGVYGFYAMVYLGSVAK